MKNHLLLKQLMTDLGIKMDHGNADIPKTRGETFGIFFAIFGAIFIPVSIYISRSLIAKVIFFASFYWILAIFIGLIIAVLLCIVLAAIYTIGWRLNWVKPGYTNVPRLLIAVLFASLLAYFGPLVSTPHQLYFEQHKSEFEHQVELIKQGNKIDHFGNLVVGIPYKTQAIVFVYLSDSLELSSYAYVYAEKYSDLDGVHMCNDASWRDGKGRIYATLSTNWYLCYRTDGW